MLQEPLGAETSFAREQNVEHTVSMQGATGTSEQYVPSPVMGQPVHRHAQKCSFLPTHPTHVTTLQDFVTSRLP